MMTLKYSISTVKLLTIYLLNKHQDETDSRQDVHRQSICSLGLPLSYDVVKMHGGEIKVDTKEGAFTEFVIQLPSNFSLKTA